MTKTIVESSNRTVVIGFDEPFCIIGEDKSYRTKKIGYGIRS